MVKRAASVLVVVLLVAVGFLLGLRIGEGQAKYNNASGFNVAQALLRAGYEKEAASEVVAVIKASPNVRVPEGLRHIGTSIPEWTWERLKPWIVYILLPLVVLGLVGWAYEHRKRRLEIRQLIVDAFGDTDLSKSFPQLLATRIQNGGPTTPKSIEWVTAPVEDLEIPTELTEAVQQFKLVSGFIKLLFPLETYTLKGALLPSGDQGVGLQLSLLDRRGRVNRSTELWQMTFDPTFRPRSLKDGDDKTDEKKGADSDRAYLSLTGPATAWAISEIEPDAIRRRRLLLGTTSWRSAAFFQMGVDWQRSGEVRYARYEYLRALAEDAANRAAAINLANLEDQAFDDGEAAISRLEKSKRLIEDAPLSLLPETQASGSQMPPYGGDDLWYRASYSLALAYYNEFKREERAGSSSNRREQAIDEAARLVLVASATLDQMRKLGNDDSRATKELEDFIREIYGATLFMLAGLLTEAKKHHFHFPAKIGAHT